MRLFQSLSKKIMPNGHIFIGKHRVEYKPDALAKDKVRYGLEIEEQNMLLLRHPYLTVEQSRGHTAHLQEERRAAMIDKAKLNSTKKWWKPVRLEDKLNHLRHSEAWDV